jgi:hypothetical protein
MHPSGTPFVVEEVDPVEGLQLDVLDAAPWAPWSDQLGRVEPGQVGDK